MSIKDLTHREISERVAVEIMGLTQDDGGEFWEGRSHVGMLPAYSTSIESAWAVVEKMKERGFHVTVDIMMKQVRVTITMVGNEYTTQSFMGKDETAAKAICLAALAAVSRPTNEKEGSRG